MSKQTSSLLKTISGPVLAAFLLSATNASAEEVPNKEILNNLPLPSIVGSIKNIPVNAIDPTFLKELVSQIEQSQKQHSDAEACTKLNDSMVEKVMSTLQNFNKEVKADYKIVNYPRGTYNLVTSVMPPGIIDPEAYKEYSQESLDISRKISSLEDDKNCSLKPASNANFQFLRATSQYGIYIDTGLHIREFESDYQTQERRGLMM